MSAGDEMSDSGRARMTLRPLVAGDEDELRRIHETPEVSRWWGAPDKGVPSALHGMGLGEEALRRVAELLVEERGHHRITIDPAVGNAAAIRAYEKVGFKPVGVMREYERDIDGAGWHDGLLMELLARDQS